MAATILFKRGLIDNMAEATLRANEMAFGWNADKTKIQLWVGTGKDDNKGKILVNPDITVPSKVSDLTNDSGFQTSAQVTAAINAAIASTYKPGGSKASVAELPALTAANEGFVYNMTAAFATTADFVEGADVSYGAGANVAIVNTGTNESPVFKYDILGGFVDLSNYVQKDGTKVLSDENYSTEEKTKLAGISADTGDTQTVSAAEKTAWNAKLDSSSVIDCGEI